LTGEADFRVKNKEKKEGKKPPSFSLNLEFLETQVEEENEIEQCKTDKEIEEFITEQRNSKTVKKTELDCKTFMSSHGQLFRPC